MLETVSFEVVMLYQFELEFWEGIVGNGQGGSATLQNFHYMPSCIKLPKLHLTAVGYVVKYMHYRHVATV